MMTKSNLIRYCLSVLALVFMSVPAFAQENQAENNVYELSARAVSGSAIITKGRTIPLWGIQAVDDAAITFKLDAQRTMDALIGSAALQCELLKTGDEGLRAQCINADRVDLAHYMLQKGYVILDRAHIYGSVFEEPYLKAEQQARQNNLGIWADGKTENSQSDIALYSLIVAALILLALIVAAIIVTRIMRDGFAQIIEAQQETLQNFNKEQILREKEKQVVASMLCSEVAENKSKVEAYLTIYEEMLSDLKDPLKTPKYKTSGDIVQKQPALDRSIFDNNASKMDLFERNMASKIVHFYARVKTAPEYVNIDSHSERDDVAAIIQEVVARAQKIDELGEGLLMEFTKYGFGKKR